MYKHVLGFPRIGEKRELKKALENYWNGKINNESLMDVCKNIKKTNWEIQKKAGLSFVATGDFSLYDQILDTSIMLGVIPERFGKVKDKIENDLYFKMARGDNKTNCHAMEMTKWFNTNYHYIVPEIEKSFTPSLCSTKIIDETNEAYNGGFNPKPVIIGPITYLSLCKSNDG